MNDKWIWIFFMVMAVSIASCTGYQHHNNTQVEIAQLECQQGDQE